MPINVNSYIEAITNPNGRFRKLDGVYCVLDETGEPVMSIDDVCIGFEVVFEGKRHILQCLLGDTGHKTRLQEVAAFTRAIESPCLMPCSYLEDEMLVFDPAGTPSYVDVLLQEKPEGMRLGDFLGGMTGSEAGGLTMKVAEGVAAMARWLDDHSFCHGNINSNNIVVKPSLVPVVTNYKSSRRARCGEQARLLCAMVAGLYCCACEPGLYEPFLREMLAGRKRLAALPDELEVLLAEEQGSPLTRLVSALAGREADTARLFSLAEELAAAQPEKIASLKKMAGHLSHDKTAGNDHAKKFRKIGEMHCNRMRAFDGNHWHYLDREGKAVISGMFTDATDFHEGRAVVETGSGFGLIDDNGRAVIEPVYDDLEWDGYNNIAVATKDGMSGLFSRSGEELTGLIYDQVLNCCEGLIPARRGRHYGYIRRDGTVAIDFRFDDAFGFRDGFARVRRGQTEYLIGPDGKEIDHIGDTPAPAEKERKA